MNIQILDPSCNGEISNPIVAYNVFDNCAEPGERVDPRLCVLARAAALHELVECCELELGEAFTRLVEAVEDFLLPLPPPNPAAKPKPPPKRAPQATLDTLIYELRTDGAARLKDKRCLGRLSDLSTEQIRDLIGRLTRLRSSYPTITDKLLFELGRLI
jgi:hypothetical protein